jgi:hypothetical protein
VRERLYRGRQPWSADEDAAILKHYVTDGPAIVGTMLGRSRHAVSRRACRLGINCDPSGTEARHKQTTTEVNTTRGPAPPKYLLKYEPYSRSWYLAQQHVFSEAMKNNPTERPS